MAKVEIIGMPQSTFVRVVRMTCEEKGVPYDLKPAAPHSPAGARMSATPSSARSRSA